MSDIITEALLEMHFHKALVDYFRQFFGKNFLRLLKPSSQQEAWVGFDQGWVHISVTTQELFQELQQAIQRDSASVGNLYLGFFLQFKRVQKMTRQTRRTPPGYSTPYLRVELSLGPNIRTGLSQHETLLRLRDIHNATVAYTCPMLLELNEIYEDPDLGRLRCVDILSSPSGWATNTKHFITFQNESDPNPLWCSEPVPGRALEFREWASPESKVGPPKLSAEEVLSLIRDAVAEMKKLTGDRLSPSLFHDPYDPTKLLPESFTLMEFGGAED